MVLGLALFVQGLEMGLFPIGESMAEAFARKGSLFWLLAFSFALGFGTTIAEPALIAVGGEAARVAGAAGFIADDEAARSSYAFSLRITVALSVGAALCDRRLPHPQGLAGPLPDHRRLHSGHRLDPAGPARDRRHRLRFRRP